MTNNNNLTHKVAKLVGLVIAWLASVGVIWWLVGSWSTAAGYLLPGDPITDVVRICELALAVIFVFLVLGRLTLLTVGNSPE